jgi:hypothetical protein
MEKKCISILWYLYSYFMHLKPISCTLKNNIDFNTTHIFFTDGPFLWKKSGRWAELFHISLNNYINRKFSTPFKIRYFRKIYIILGKKTSTLKWLYSMYVWKSLSSVNILIQSKYSLYGYADWNWFPSQGKHICTVCIFSVLYMCTVYTRFLKWIEN